MWNILVACAVTLWRNTNLMALAQMLIHLCVADAIADSISFPSGTADMLPVAASNNSPNTQNISKYGTIWF